MFVIKCWIIDKIYDSEQKLTNLKQELEETKGLFKEKERKQLKEQIGVLEQLLESQKIELSKIVQKHGFETVKEFIIKYNELYDTKEMYEWKLQNWEQENVPMTWPEEMVERNRRQRERERERQMTRIKNMKGRSREER